MNDRLLVRVLAPLCVSRRLVVLSSVATLLLTLVSSSLLVAGEMRALVWLGFQNSDTVARVFVKTNEAIQYKISEGKENTLELDLFDTRLQHENYRRNIDTTQFDSVVTSVSADEREGAGRQVRVRIALKRAAAYEVKQEGDTLSVEIKNR